MLFTVGVSVATLCAGILVTDCWHYVRQESTTEQELSRKV